MNFFEGISTRKELLLQPLEGLCFGEMQYFSEEDGSWSSFYAFDTLVASNFYCADYFPL